MTLTIKRPRTTVELCLDMSLQTKWEAANNLLARQTASKEVEKMLVDVDMQTSAAAIKAIEAEMDEHVLIFELEAMDRKAWGELEAAHPPREGVAEDDRFSVNVSTFVDVAMVDSIVAVTRKVTGEVVEFDPASEWMGLADQMSDGQWSDFTLKLFGLNRGTIAAPFSRAASLLTRPSEKTSSSPSASGSASSD